MRIFLAITVPDGIKTAFVAATQRLVPVASEVKWCDRGQLHLTLVFLGEAAPPIVPHLTAATERVCSAMPPFVCRARGLGFFGSKRTPTALWAGVEPSLALTHLHERLWAELTKFGYTNDAPDFHPHVTLGRCRESTNNRSLIEAMAADDSTDFGSWSVSRVTVYESRLTPRGAVYHTLARVTLGGL